MKLIGIFYHSPISYRCVCIYWPFWRNVYISWHVVLEETDFDHYWNVQCWRSRQKYRCYRYQFCRTVRKLHPQNHNKFGSSMYHCFWNYNFLLLLRKSHLISLRGSMHNPLFPSSLQHQMFLDFLAVNKKPKKFNKLKNQ